MLRRAVVMTGIDQDNGAHYTNPIMETSQDHSSDQIMEKMASPR